MTIQPETPHGGEYDPLEALQRVEAFLRSLGSPEADQAAADLNGALYDFSVERAATQPIPPEMLARHARLRGLEVENTTLRERLEDALRQLHVYRWGVQSFVESLPGLEDWVMTMRTRVVAEMPTDPVPELVPRSVRVLPSQDLTITPWDVEVPK